MSTGTETDIATGIGIRTGIGIGTVIGIGTGIGMLFWERSCALEGAGAGDGPDGAGAKEISCHSLKVDLEINNSGHHLA